MFGNTELERRLAKIVEYHIEWVLLLSFVPIYMNIQWSIRRREPARELFIYSCMVAVVNDRYGGFIIIASIYLFVSYRIKTHPFLDMHIKIV